MIEIFEEIFIPPSGSLEIRVIPQNYSGQSTEYIQRAFGSTESRPNSEKRVRQLSAFVLNFGLVRHVSITPYGVLRKIHAKVGHITRYRGSS
jgi:hypothetical protein